MSRPYELISTPKGHWSGERNELWMIDQIERVILDVLSDLCKNAHTVLNENMEFQLNYGFNETNTLEKRFYIFAIIIRRDHPDKGRKFRREVVVPDNGYIHLSEYHAWIDFLKDMLGHGLENVLGMEGKLPVYR